MLLKSSAVLAAVVRVTGRKEGISLEQNRQIDLGFSVRSNQCPPCLVQMWSLPPPKIKTGGHNAGFVKLKFEYTKQSI